jgi:hypothetical protein
MQVKQNFSSKLAGKFAKLCFMLIETVSKQKFLSKPYL